MLRAVSPCGGRYPVPSHPVQLLRPLSETRGRYIELSILKPPSSVAVTSAFHYESDKFHKTKTQTIKETARRWGWYCQWCIAVSEIVQSLSREGKGAQEYEAFKCGSLPSRFVSCIIKDVAENNRYLV